MVLYEKTYKGVLVNFETEVLGKLDQYRHGGKSRTRLIHEAVTHYVEHLESQNARKSVWQCQMKGG